MFEKIKKLPKHKYADQLRDVRVIGLIVFVVIALLVTWSGLDAIQRNYDLQKQISRLEQENEVKDLENRNLEFKNQYYNTDQYLELQARRQFGRAAPGETLVLIPKSVAIEKTIEPIKENEGQAVPAPKKPSYQVNFEAWIQFFFRKG